MMIHGRATQPETELLAALREIYDLAKNGVRLPIHGKSKIANIARRAITEATGESPQ